MGWLWLALFGIAAMAALLLLGVGRRLWSLVGAALMLGAAGYTVQGSPMLAASPAAPAPPEGADDADLVAIRDQMMGTHTAADVYLLAADAIGRSGDRHAAARLLLGGLHAMPKNLALWTAFGTALAANDKAVSPPALFAFQQAMRLNPRHPGPPFFLGTAYVRAGDFAAARLAWGRALALSAPNAPYREGLAERVALLDRFLATDGR